MGSVTSLSIESFRVCFIPRNIIDRMFKLALVLVILGCSAFIGDAAAPNCNQAKITDLLEYACTKGWDYTVVRCDPKFSNHVGDHVMKYIRHRPDGTDKMCICVVESDPFGMRTTKQRC